MAILDVRPGERRRTLLLFFYVLSASALFGLGRNVRDTLLLGSFDISIYPWMFVAYAVASSFVAVFYGRIADKVRREKLMFATLFAGVGTYAVVWTCSRGGLRLAYPVFWCLADVISNLVLLQFWAFANELHDARDAKRLFGVIGSGFSVGMALCGFGASALAKRIGAASLLLVMIGLAGLVAALIVALRGYARAAPAAARAPGRKAAPPASPLAEPYPRILAAMLLCIFVLCPIEQFQFTAISRKAFTDAVSGQVSKDDLARFFGFFYGGLGTLAFLFQLFLTPRILARFGVKVSMRIMPSALLLTSLAVLFWPTLLVAALLRFSDNGFQFTVHDATMQILYFPFPANAKQRLRAFLDALVKPCSYGVGGLIIILAGKRLAVPQLSYVTVPLACVWLAITFAVRRRYVKALERTLHSGMYEEEAHELTIEDYVGGRALLLDAAGSADAEVARFAFERLERANAPELAHRLAPLISSGPRHSTLLALARVAHAPETRYRDAVQARLDDPDPEIAGAAALAFAAMARDGAIPDLERLLDSPAPALRAAAVAGLIVHCGLDGALVGMPRLKMLLESQHAEERAVAASALSLMGEGAAGALERLFGDDDVHVRRTALAAAGKVCAPRLMEPLGAALNDRQVAHAAGRALARYGDAAVPWLHAMLEDRDMPLRVRMAVPPILREIATPCAYDALLWSIHVEHGVLRSRVLLAASTLRVALGLPLEKPQTTGRHLEREARELYWLLANAERLASAIEAPLLLDGARTQARRALARMFRILELAHDRSTIAVAAHELMHGATGAVRANSLEVLENALEDEEKALVFPALEEAPILARLETVPIAVSALEPEEWLAELLAHVEPWLRACAIDAIRRGERRGVAERALECLRDPDAIVREALATMTRELEPEGAAATLEALAADPDPHVRRATREARENIVEMSPRSGPPRVVREA